MIDNRAVGKTIAALRQNRNMTQQQLAATLNVSHQAVSKWENGAALPDVQTLMALTRLFGITMEQLLNGEVPPERLQPERTGLEEPIQNIGNFINNIVSGIFQTPQSDDDAGTEDGAADAVTEEATEQPDFDLEKLLQMAPFMSRAAVDALLMAHKDRLTSADIARFAPFISRECLEKLMQNPESEITWETLQKIAPFLKREMVDRLAWLAAKGSQFVQDATQNVPGGDDIGRAIGDVSQTIGRGVKKVVRKAGKLGEGVVNEVVNAYNSIVEGTKERDDRVNALRRAAYQRALQDERWDWLTEHIDEIDDEELLNEIAQKANRLGMHDWVVEHMTGYADTNAVDQAIEGGDWNWLGDHVWQFEPSVQEKVALAAARAENWQWLSTYAEQIALENCADQIAVAAYRGEARELALQLATHCMPPAQRETLANDAVNNDDYDFLEQLAPRLSPEYFGRLCVARAQDKRWNVVSRFAARADHDSLENMMELAIAEGNFDAVDALNPLL